MDQHVAVVGAGLGGLRTAEQLRAAGHDGPVTVIGAEPYPPYNRPPLSKELLAYELVSGVTADGDGDGGTASGAGEAPALLERVAFRRRASVADVTFRLGAAVTAADLASRTLALADGAEVRFDALVAATGLRPRTLDVPGPCGPGSGRHVLRSLDDAARLRAGLRALLRPAAGEGAGGPAPRVVVVGAGFVGCEVACTARSLGCDVTVVDPAGPPLLRVVGPEVAAAVQASHERAGIAFVAGQAVSGYAGRERVTGVTLAGGAVLPAALVVEAVGSVPNTGWLAGTGLDLTDGVLCDNHLAAVRGAAGGVPVTATGDVARFPNPLLDDVPRRVEHWSMPSDTARRAAATLRAALTGSPPDPAPFRPVPSFWSDQGDLRMWSFGSPGLADDVTVTEGDLCDPGSGLLASYRRGGRLVGSLAVNLPPLRNRELRQALLDG